MTSQQFLTADLLDIVFDNRNKSYGAYTLRRQYPAHLTKAIVYAFLPVAAALCFIRPSGTTITIAKTQDSVVVSTYQIPEVAKPKEPLPKPQQPASTAVVKQVKYTDYRIVKTDRVPPVASIADIEHAVVSTATTPGPKADHPFVKAPAPVTTGGGGVPGTETPPVKEAVKPDRQPQFPGGMKAWADFLNHNLHTPQDLENGEKRTVNIRFHVDVDGTVTGFQVAQSGGSAFDNEVIRVLKKMPKWTPALLAGQPVAISFTQPVTFVGVEE